MKISYSLRYDDMVSMYSNYIQHSEKINQTKKLLMFALPILLFLVYLSFDIVILIFIVIVSLAWAALLEKFHPKYQLNSMIANTSDDMFKRFISSYDTELTNDYILVRNKNGTERKVPWGQIIQYDKDDNRYYIYVKEDQILILPRNIEDISTMENAQYNDFLENNLKNN